MQMRVACVLVLAFGATLPGSDKSRERERQQEKEEEAIYQFVARSLEAQGTRAKSGLLDLKYWRGSRRMHSSCVRHAIRGKDSRQLEVVLLEAPAGDWPNYDFGVAFLVSNGRVVDWKACWTYRRTALLSQALMVEDVDGDGFVDVAFRMGPGASPGRDELRHSRPRDPREWWHVYAMTSDGFRSLFPGDDQQHRLKVAYESSGAPVELHADGVPSRLGDNELFSCTIRLTNVSKSDLKIQPGGWFDVEARPPGGIVVTYENPDRRTVIKPHESVSQSVQIHLRPAGEVATLLWKFVESR
jgi:hypothetical protein